MSDFCPKKILTRVNFCEVRDSGLPERHSMRRRTSRLTRHASPAASWMWTMSARGADARRELSYTRRLGAVIAGTPDQRSKRLASCEKVADAEIGSVRTDALRATALRRRQRLCSLSPLRARPESRGSDDIAPGADRGRWRAPREEPTKGKGGNTSGSPSEVPASFVQILSGTKRPRERDREPIGLTKRKTPRPLGSGRSYKSLTITYFHKRNANYHRRKSVSRSCSGWEGVVPPCYGHQA